MYTMYTDVFSMELVRLSLIQNADECLGWMGDVVCRTGKPDRKWCDGSEGISRKSFARPFYREDTGSL